MMPEYKPQGHKMILHYWSARAPEKFRCLDGELVNEYVQQYGQKLYELFCCHIVQCGNFYWAWQKSLGEKHFLKKLIIVTSQPYHSLLKNDL
jgi:hypothetical protein